MKLKRLILVLGALICSTLPVSALAQDFRHDGKSMVPITQLAVEYTVHGTVQPESSLVRCQMDLLYRNISTDTLHELYLRLPQRPVGTGPGVSRSACHIDSILMYGVPVRPDSASLDGSPLRIRFSRPLLSGGTVPFLISFETTIESLHQPLKKKGAMIVVDHWLPEACARKDGRWFLPHVGDCEIPAEIGQYDVALTIDSSFAIAAPGELLNEKEFYGFLPPSGTDTVLVDVADSRRPNPGPTIFRPVFTNGRKTYAWRLRSGTSFPIAVGQSVAVDRIALKGTVVETYYGRKSNQWGGTLVRQAAELVVKCEKLLGQCPKQKLAIAQAQIKQPYTFSSGLNLLPEHENKVTRLVTPLAIGIARCWLPDILPGDNQVDSVLASGLAAYIGYSLVDPNQTLNYLKSLHLDSHPTAERSYREGQEFINVPSWLHVLQHTCSDSVFWAGIRNFCSESRTSSASPVDFQKFLNSAVAGDLNWFFQQWDRPTTSFDYSLTGAACQQMKDSFVTVVTMARGKSPAVPLELGYIFSDSDTLFARVSYRDVDSAGSPYSIQQVSKLPVKAVVLDPHVWLPDSNRNNNCVPIDKGYRCRSVTPTFPPYRVLEGR